MTKTKQEGKCPYCEKLIEPRVLEENTIRRDKCECPECHKPIYACRIPSCHNYAKGTDNWDHEMCVEHFDASSELFKSALSWSVNFAKDIVKDTAKNAIQDKFGKKDDKENPENKSKKEKSPVSKKGAEGAKVK